MEKINHSNNTSRTIVLLDSFNDLENHSKIIGNSEFEIITFNYNLHKILKSKNIHHKISDQFLINDTNYIQEISRNFSYWYKESDILDFIKYKEINLGKLFYPEFHYFLVPFLKSYFEILKICQEYKKNTFITSPNLFEITKLFSDSVRNLSPDETFSTNYLYDSLKIPINIGKINYSIRLPNSYFKKLKNISEKLLKPFFTKKFRIPTDPSILLVEFDTIRHKKLFEAAKNFNLNFVNYGRRRPIIWNHKSFSIIKNSNCSLIDFNKIFDDDLKQSIYHGEIETKEKLKKLWEKQEFFQNYFSIDNLSFWNILKPIFINLTTKRTIDAILEIEIVKKIFQLYNFKNILILSEHGFNEQILIQIAKQENIPITLVQHGVFYDTKEALSQNIFAGMLPIESDLFFAWGNTVKEYLINSNIPSEKIQPLGSIVYDEIFEKKQEKSNSKSEHILFAIAWPLKSKVSNLTVKTLESYELCIKEICTIISNKNKKLIVKVHPYFEQEDFTNFIKKINPEITVIKNGDILDLIQSCQLFITVDLSTTILEAQIMEKPVISVIVPTFSPDLGNPEIFKNNSCIRVSINDFENELNHLMTSSDYRQQIINQGNKFVKKYLSNTNASFEILSYLEKF